MRYEGNICPGCGEVFTQDDDVVVCPECATAQHRECYKKKGECVNAHLHSTSFQWQPEKGVSEQSSSTLINQQENKKTFECPACKNMCDPDKGYCEKCGAKFIVFGKNFAKEIQAEQEKINELKGAKNTPQVQNKPEHYKPPFEIGVGEGFDDNEKQSDDLQSIPVLQSQQSDEASVQNKGYNEQGEEILYFSGPFNVKDTIDGVSVNTIGSFVRTEALRYIDKFKKLSSGAVLSFNWAAFLLAPYWFFYRKLYKSGVIFMTLETLVSIITTYFSYEAVAELAKYGLTLDDLIYGNVLLTDLSEYAVRLMEYVCVCAFAVVVFHVIAGFVADRVYKKYVIKNAGSMEKMANHNSAYAFATKNGGTSLMVGFLSCFAYNIISYLIGTFFV